MLIPNLKKIDDMKPFYKGKLFILWIGYLISFFPNMGETAEYIGAFHGGGFSRDIVINGNLAYVANGYNGLQVLNVTNPSAISHIRTISPPYVPNRSAYNLLLDNPYLYMTDRTGGLLTYDVSDPANPTLVSVNMPQKYSNTVAKYNGVLFIGEVTGGLVAYNLDNPGQPVEIGRVKIPNAENPKESQGMAFKNNYAYVANPWGGLAVVNISDPTIMILEGYYDKPLSSYPGVWDVAISGDFVFLVAQRYGIQVLNISNPVAPVLVSELLLPINYTQGIDSPPNDIKLMNERYIVVPNGGDGVYLVDISDPYNIHVAEKITPGSAYSWGVRIEGDHLFIACAYDGVEVYDVSEYAPAPIPSLNLPSLIFLIVVLLVLGTSRFNRRYDVP